MTAQATTAHLHQLSYRHGITSGWSDVQRSLLEQGTCMYCGERIWRRCTEGQNSVQNRRPFVLKARELLCETDEQRDRAREMFRRGILTADELADALGTVAAVKHMTEIRVAAAPMVAPSDPSAGGNSSGWLRTEQRGDAAVLWTRGLLTDLELVDAIGGDAWTRVAEVVDRARLGGVERRSVEQALIAAAV